MATSLRLVPSNCTIRYEPGSSCYVWKNPTSNGTESIFCELFSARECAKQVGFDWETIRSCTNSRIGHERQFAAGLETKFIGLRSVPHVRYNGLVDDSGLLRQNPLQFICQNYADQPAIEACEPFFEA